jgi:hypothetical protein
MKSYDIKWQRDDDKIIISKGYFEHLLNCLANQKYIEELPPNGDALAEGEENYRNIQEENQMAIDKAWREGMFILSLNHRSKEEYNKIWLKYCGYCGAQNDFSEWPNMSPPKILEEQYKKWKMKRIDEEYEEWEQKFL